MGKSFFIGFIAPFAAGIVFAANSVILFGYDENYDAASWKMIVAIFVGLGCWIAQKK